MSRFSRINTIWRKELVDTLRDRRTLLAMILVPMVLYPALMLGSLQALELQVGYLAREQYDVAVASEHVQAWLRRLIDSDPARRAAGVAPTAEPTVSPSSGAEHSPREELSRSPRRSKTESVRAGVRQAPPAYRILVVQDVVRAVQDGQCHAGILPEGSLPGAEQLGSTTVHVVLDDSEIRSEIAASGLIGILERRNAQLVQERLQRYRLDLAFIQPLAVEEQNVATPEKQAGSILGQIVPLILIIMTITGGIYPAIDLTAGERERGTLETLMVAPVPTVDLIAGKFIVVTLIGLLSAALNLLSIGGTIYLGGLGEVLTRGGQFVFPLSALPWILLMLVPLAVMFSAMLLAVSSFARSFKEAQNYVVPVMIAALIPAVVGVLPGMRLEGPLLVMPVANIVILTRELFMGRLDLVAVAWVTLSTTIYASAAVAVAAKLFGQEAVLFADSASVRTLFVRKFFKPQAVPSAAQALLLLAVVYPLNFFIQQRMLQAPGLLGTPRFFYTLAIVLVVLFALLPAGAARYMRVSVRGAFSLTAPHPLGWLAALCLGSSTWILARAWYRVQQDWFPMLPELERLYEQVSVGLEHLPLATTLLLVAAVPALCEELFFRGYVLGGLRATIGRVAAIILVALAFAVYHHSVFRFAVTAALGVLFGLLSVQWRSIWPAVVAHLLHNGLSVASARSDGLLPLLQRHGFDTDGGALPPAVWLLAATTLVAGGVLLSLFAPRSARSRVAVPGPLPDSAPLR